MTGIQPTLVSHGGGHGLSNDGAVLAHIASVAEGGVCLEAGPRRADLLIERAGVNGCEPVATPGTGVGKKDGNGGDPLGNERYTHYRL